MVADNNNNSNNKIDGDENGKKHSTVNDNSCLTDR